MALEQLALGKIRAAEDQPRKTFYQESLEELAASIKERGVLEPIVVRPMKNKDGSIWYQIVMGERRFRASKLAGKETIPAIVKNMTDEEAAADALLENFQREDLNPVEKAYAVQGLLQFMSYEKAARTLGISETTVRRTLELLDLPPALQRELIERPNGSGAQTFGEGHARVLMAFNDDPATQNMLVEKIKKERISVAALEQIVDAIRKYPAKKAIFLHVASGVTDQMARSFGAQEERKKPYRSQTAREHLKAIDKQTNATVEILDERVVEFLSLEEMNQLLATMERTTRYMEAFARKVREALENRDYGFREVYTHCPLCGRIELVGGKRCAVCYTILRRCIDCGHYDKAYERCGALGGPPIDLDQAEAPTDKSRSYQCPEYLPKFTPQGFKLKMASLK